MQLLVNPFFHPSKIIAAPFGSDFFFLVYLDKTREPLFVIFTPTTFDSSYKYIWGAYIDFFFPSSILINLFNSGWIAFELWIVDVMQIMLYTQNDAILICI